MEGVLLLMGGGGLLLLGVSACGAGPGVERAGVPWRVLRLRPAFKTVSFFFFFVYNFGDGQLSTTTLKASQIGRSTDVVGFYSVRRQLDGTIVGVFVACRKMCNEL